MIFLGFSHAQTNTALFQTFVQKKMDEYGVVGASIAIVKNFHIASSQGFGYRDIRKTKPVNPQTVFNVASISKPVSAVAAYRVFGDKEISLDQNISLFLNGWKIPEKIENVTQPVTMRLLLSHTAGISGVRCKGYGTNQILPSVTQT